MKQKEKWAEEYYDFHYKGYHPSDIVTIKMKKLTTLDWLAGFEFAKNELLKAQLSDMVNRPEKTIIELGEEEV